MKDINKLSTNIALWFYPKNLDSKPTTREEKEWASELSCSRKKEYLYARGYLRMSLSDLFGIDNLKIPLYAPPSKSPKLKNGMGYTSISHCDNGLLIGWSKEKIGVDLERKDRLFDHKNLIKKYYFDSEKEFIKNCKGESPLEDILSIWVLKESAIKWQEGSVFADIHKWESKIGFIENKVSQIKLKSYLLNYKSWLLGVVSNSEIKTSLPIVCTL